MGRSPCCEKAHTNKGAWSPEEDQLLLDYILRHGQGCWRSLPKSAGLLRCGKSCRLRWMNYLRPDLKRGNFTDEEDELIIKLHSLLGNKWSLIAGRLPGRTDNEIKNYWNTHIKRKLLNRGVDPQTHRPLAAAADNPQPELKNAPLPVLETSSVSQIIDLGKSGDSDSMEGGGACSSGTTTTVAAAAAEEEEEGGKLRKGGGVDLELSIGLFGFRAQNKASSACSASIAGAKGSVSPPVEVVAVKGVCLWCQLGFQGGQVCSGCQTTKIVL